MPKENEKQRTFTRRTVLFGGVQLAALTALAGRLFYLQFIKASEYATLSQNNRIKLQLVPPERGLLLDRIGIPMARNERNYRLLIDPSGLDKASFHQALDEVHALLPIEEKRLEQLRKLRISIASLPEVLRDHLTWEEVSLIELHRVAMPGVFIEAGQLRHYPFEQKAAHLIGYVGAVSEDDLKRAENQPLLRLPEFKIGKNGIEKMLEEELRGEAGIRQIEVNVHGVSVREIGHQDSIPGRNVTLTIDSRLQDYTAELVKNESAAVVAMEVDTGNVLALVSMPGFDPNSFSKGIRQDYWNELNKNKKHPLLNKAISGQYPPGSTFKMLVGLAGLEAGAIKTHSTVYCPGHFMLGDHRFNCWKPEGHGTMSFHEAVEQSCDTFFYTVADRIGIEKFADMARRFGLGHTHGIGIIGEKEGIIPDPAWKMKRYQQRWTGGDTINCAIGQGYVLSTPLQLAIMTCRMATGRMVEPRLLVPAGQEKPEFAPVQIKPELLALNRKAMTAVVNSPSGTGYGRRIHQPEWAFAGKTGTSQVRAITQRGVNQNLLPWEHRHHALFVGFAPADQPKYAVAVIVEHGGGGASAAAPVARDVLFKIQQLEAEDNGTMPPPPPPPPRVEAPPEPVEEEPQEELPVTEEMEFPH